MRLTRLARLLGRQGSVRIRFSQYGEDTIIRKLFNRKEGFYVDVGAHHPFRQSNTAYLWCLGWNGVNVDANPKCIEIFRKVRTGDTNIWSAIVSEAVAARQTHVDLYTARDLDLSATVSADLAGERGARTVTSVPCTTLKRILADHAAGAPDGVDFLNIDIEGLDEAAVEDIADWPVRPKVIALETYAPTIPEVLTTGIHERLTGAGYDYRYQIGLTSVYVLKGFAPSG
ncbi:FkbM family methyltransferase [Frigidibacter sp. RF13]|uniref:FkbM family methyltransferase n=1 Tax=Frigidibacter sp. RF13 TaxID=2997340 RepID=UPI002271CE7A|nr:FkbM family methyltransferase [Frigidibacter sp. RF13]MCY1126806.1 FkbM family methyltransferase [Frigidibacter sp. RF13]